MLTSKHGDDINLLFHTMFSSLLFLTISSENNLSNKAILKLVDNDNNKIAKHHYIKQDLGHKFLYNCENYAIKLKKLENEVCECIITKYKVEKNNEIVINRFGFIYDFINERILKYTILSNSSNTLYGDEEVIKVFK